MSVDAQKFCLRWHDFRTSVTAAFEGLRHDEELVDMTLCCDGRKIKAHRMMLSACSPFFRDLFKENPCQHPVFILRDVTFDDLRAVVEFVYRGEVNIAQSQLASFLKTAEMLQLRGLTEDDGRSSVNMDTSMKMAASPPVPSPPGRASGSRGGRSHASDSPNKRRPASPPPPAAVDVPSQQPMASPVGSKRRKQAEPEAIRPLQPEPQPAPAPEPPPAVSPGTSSTAAHQTGSHTPAPLTEVKVEVVEHVPVMPYEAVSAEYAALAGFQQMEALGRQALQRHDLTPGFTIGMSGGRVLEPEQFPPVGGEVAPLAGVAGGEVAPLPGAAGAARGVPLERRTCHLCGKVFRHRESLCSHMDLHRGDTTCCRCGKVLSTKQVLRVHLKTVHDMDLQTAMQEVRAGRLPHATGRGGASTARGSHAAVGRINPAVWPMGRAGVSSEIEEWMDIAGDDAGRAASDSGRRSSLTYVPAPAAVMEGLRQHTSRGILSPANVKPFRFSSPDGNCDADMREALISHSDADKRNEVRTNFEETIVEPSDSDCGPPTCQPGSFSSEVQCDLNRYEEGNELTADRGLNAKSTIGQIIGNFTGNSHTGEAISKSNLVEGSSAKSSGSDAADLEAGQPFGNIS